MYLVRHRTLDVLRIAKIVGKCTPDYERIYQEAQLLKGLNCKGIPLIYDIIENSDSICMIEEYISGKSLTNFIQEQKRLDFVQIIAVSEQLCKILEYLHTLKQGAMLYLDLKPDNIIIDGDNKVWLIDFDNSIRLGQEVRHFYGSIDFAAPEQFESSRTDVRADIYSLGKIIMYMDSGHIHSNADKLHHKELYPIITKCIRHNPKLRYKSVCELRQALDGLKGTSADKSNDNSRIIYVYGMKSGDGVTHLSMCITAFLKRKGKKSVYIKRNHNNKVCIQTADILMDNGVCSYRGIDVCPDYEGRIMPDLSKYNVFVIDADTMPMDTDWAERYTAMSILVMTYGYDKKTVLNRLLNESNSQTVFINHISGEAFHKAVKTFPDTLQYYRIPCVYNFETKNALLDKQLEQLFAEAGVIKAARLKWTHRIAWRRYFGRIKVFFKKAYKN